MSTLEPDVDPIVYWYVLQCPRRSCRGDKCPVIHTEGQIRQHKCRKCGTCFKSVPYPLMEPETVQS